MSEYFGSHYGDKRRATAAFCFFAVVASIAAVIGMLFVRERRFGAAAHTQTLPLESTLRSLVKNGKESGSIITIVTSFVACE